MDDHFTLNSVSSAVTELNVVYGTESIEYRRNQAYCPLVLEHQVKVSQGIP